MTKFQIVPNGFSPLLIGMTQAEVEQACGELLVSQTAALKGEVAYGLESLNARVVLREDRVVEIGLYPPAIVLFGDRSLFDDKAVWRDIVELDGSAQQTLGFIVLLNLRLTLTGFHDGDVSQLAITAFEPGRWDILVNEMRPFRC